MTVLRDLFFSVVLLSAFWVQHAYAQDKISANSSDKFIGLSLYGEMGEVKAKATPYLGTQVGAGPNVFGLVKTNNDLAHRAKGAHISFGKPQALNFHADFSEGQGKQAEDFSTIDPQGDNLLIPGVGTDAAGAVGAGFLLPGPNNQIENAHHDFDYDYYRLAFGLSKDIKLYQQNTFITPAVDIVYGRNIVQQSFNGSIPFFVREFSYNTKTEIKTISPSIGLSALHVLSPLFSLQARMNYALDFNWAQGRDSLFFTGFGQQVAPLKDKEITSSYQAGVGIILTPPRFPEISLEGAYHHFGNAPMVRNRDGSSNSRIDFTQADELSAQLRLTARF